MIDKKFFSKLKKDYIGFDANRRVVISKSNDILKLSKQAIFALHRNEIKQADTALKECERLHKSLQSLFKKDKKLEFQGAYEAGMEEYAEARLFYNYIRYKRVTGIKEIALSNDAYIGGLSDFTGELVRYATREATKNHIDEVQKVYDTVEKIIQQLLLMNIVGSLRNKYDQATNNLRKLEGMLYDITLKQRS